VPLLLDALRQQDLDVGDVDFVFLTHVHLDHAGGAGELMLQLPNASCVIHPYGAPHMIDPGKLVAGTEAVYGKEQTAETYGTIARHHYVLNDPQSKSVFTGDSFGVSYRELDSDNGEIVFPTSTPVQFNPVEAHKSVDRIMACEPEHVFLTHYSKVGNLDRLAAEMHEGIDTYVALARQHEDDDDRSAALRESLFEYYVDRLDAHGYSGDREMIQAIMGIDIELNAQGLEFWLEKQ
jgi:Cft2 family RNA processing exonuclease